MFDTLKRIRLRRKGLSCGKVRRKHGDKEVTEFLRSSSWVRALIFLAFLGGCLALLAYPVESNSGSIAGLALGETFFEERPTFAIALMGIAAVSCLIHLYLNHPWNFGNNARFLLFFGSLWVHLFVLKAVLIWCVTQGFVGREYLLALPMAIAPLVLSVLATRNLGLFAAIATTVLGIFLVPKDHVLLFLVINLACGLTALIMTENIRRRGRLLRAGVVVGVIGTFFCWLCGLLEIPPAGGDWASLWPMAFIPFGAALVAALLLGGILPVLETVFQSTTAMSWIESADLNHPLMRRLIEEAPGTYQHSLVVARIAESAAEAIGANAPMCRACAYFHDIGKLSKPGYFIENVGEGENPHNELTPNMSALVIIAHVKDGVHMALEARLKYEIIDAIEQHHGTSLVYSFYRKALDAHEEMTERVREGLATEEEIPEINEESFRYPGPKPQTKEIAILSLADSVESASRSLKKPTPQRITQLVDDIVLARIEDGQLDECDLTFQELVALRTSFADSLRSMLHSRIAYPDKDKKDAAERLEEREKGEATEKKKKAKREAAASGAGEEKSGKKAKSKPKKDGKASGPEKTRPERAAVVRSTRR